MEQIQKPEARSPWSRGPAETTGVLKIFFGYAAGVGKTYAMLEAAHQAQKNGHGKAADDHGQHQLCGNDSQRPQQSPQ